MIDPTGNTPLPLGGALLIGSTPAGWIALGLLAAAAIVYAAEHTKNARKSTQSKHEKGQARKNRDNGNERGDVNRKPNMNKKKTHNKKTLPKTFKEKSREEKQE